MKKLHILQIILLVLLVFSVSGCLKRGPQLAPVKGKVTYKGKPLPFGSVILQPAAGQPAIGAIQSDGTFQVQTPGHGDGAPVGVNRIQIICYEKIEPKTPGGEIGMGKSLIPQKYTSYTTSGLTIDVQPGGNDLILDLKD